MNPAYGDRVELKLAYPDENLKPKNNVDHEYDDTNTEQCRQLDREIN